jgi:hypothetical protein
MSDSVHTQILIGAKEILSDSKRWTKGAIARNVHGSATAESDSDAVCWCLNGAICKAERDAGLWPLLSESNTSVQDFIYPVIPAEYISYYNDAEETTHSDLMSTLDKAIELSRKGLSNATD